MNSIFARPFLWCCAGCIRGDDNSTQYYSLLGLTPFATQDEIKKAWRKISLQMHPDKLAQRGQVVGTKEQEEFSKAKDAYQVLSNPSRRQIYDAYGANGVKWIEDPSNINPHVFLSNFTKSSVQDRCRVVTVFFLIFIAILLFPILLSLKLDGSDIGWFIVFIPLFVYELLVISIQLVALKKLTKTIQEQKAKATSSSSSTDCAHEDNMRRETSSSSSSSSSSTTQNENPSHKASHNSQSATQSSDDNDSGSDNDDEIDDDDAMLMGGDVFDRQYAKDVTKAGLITSVLGILWQFLLVLRLQWNKSFGLSYGGTLCPLLLSEVFECYHNNVMSNIALEAAQEIIVPTTYDEGGGGSQGGDSPQAKLKAIRLMLGHSARRAVYQHALRACFVVLLMLKVDSVEINWWVVFMPLWILFCYECLADVLELGGVNQSGESETNPAAIVLHACCGIGVVFTMVLLACMKISGASFSAFWIFCPVFFIGGCLLCCITCVVCCTIDTEGGGEDVNYSPLVDSQGRTAEAERPPTPERSRPPRPSYTDPVIDAETPISLSTAKVEDSVIDIDLFHPPPALPVTEKSPILNDID